MQGPFHHDKSSSFNNKKVNKYLFGERDIWSVAHGKRCTTPVSHYELIKQLSSYWPIWPNEKHLHVLLFHLSLWKRPFNCKTSDNAVKSVLCCVFFCGPLNVNYKAKSVSHDFIPLTIHFNFTGLANGRKSALCTAGDGSNKGLRIEGDKSSPNGNESPQEWTCTHMGKQEVWSKWQRNSICRVGKHVHFA